MGFYRKLLQGFDDAEGETQKANIQMLALQPVRILYFRDENREKERRGLAGKVIWDGKKDHLNYSIKFLDIVITVDNSSETCF